MSDQLKIQDSPDEIHISTHPSLSFSAQTHYTVYVKFSTAYSESVITESTNFSKLHVHIVMQCILYYSFLIMQLPMLPQ